MTLKKGLKMTELHIVTFFFKITELIHQPTCEKYLKSRAAVTKLSKKYFFFFFAHLRKLHSKTKMQNFTF